jgi:hypothetical protein
MQPPPPASSVHLGSASILRPAGLNLPVGPVPLNLPCDLVVFPAHAADKPVLVFWDGLAPDALLRAKAAARQAQCAGCSLVCVLFPAQVSSDAQLEADACGGIQLWGSTSAQQFADIVEWLRLGKAPRRPKEDGNVNDDIINSWSRAVAESRADSLSSVLRRAKTLQAVANLDPATSAALAQGDARVAAFFAQVL